MTPEHKTFFGFSRTPFNHKKDEKPWLDATREKAFERLKLLTLNPGFAVLHGPPGCGKTRLLQHFERSLNTNTHQSAYIANSNLNDSGVLQLICWHLGVEPSNSKAKNIRRLTTHLRDARTTAVVILDELQHATAQTLEAVRLLAEFDIGAGPQFTLILAGTDDIIGLLGMNVCESLRQRITMRLSIKPLERDQIPHYIEHHFKTAHVNHEIISPPAMNHIADSTGCIPRLIEHLTRSALICAAEDNSQTIELRHVDEAEQMTFLPQHRKPEGP
jgi:general secretion pathway protein A